MKYIFCIVVNLATLAAITLLGYLLVKGGSQWLILVMCILAFRFVIPASSLYTCPQCGHTAKAKVFETIAGKMPQGEET